MKRLLLLASMTLFLAGCDSGNDQQDDPIADNQPANQLDGHTAPTDRDPTPQAGTGGQIPTESPTGSHQR
jgi:uncharacterized lipoprotein